MTEQWERQRLCSKVEPAPWDIDAGYEPHRWARWACRKRCPVLEACRARAEVDRPTGLFAGQMWNGTVGPVEVEKWHSTRGGFKPGRKPDPNWTDQERRCEGPGCDVVFTATARSKTRKFCSSLCSSRSRYPAHAGRRSA